MNSVINSALSLFLNRDGSKNDCNIIQSKLSTNTISLPFTVHKYSIMSIRFYCVTHLLLLLFPFYNFIIVHFFYADIQYASIRFMKDACNGPLLLAFLPMLNHPELHKRCFTIGLKETPTANAPNAENKLRVIMASPGCIVDGATLQ